MKLLNKIRSAISPRKAGHEPDKLLILDVGLIVVAGLILLSSVSAVSAYSQFGSSYYYLNHQLIGVVIGGFLFFFLSRIDYHVWRKYGFLFLIISILFLVLVFIPGLSAKYGTAQSWINVGGFSLQPSEFVKIFFLIYLVAWLERRKDKLSQINEGILPFLLVLGVIAALMLMQPDLGTLFIIAATSFLVYFIGGGKKFHLAVIFIFGSLFLALVVNFYPYQMDRIKCWSAPDFDSRDTCYQVNQSLIAVGSGGILGKGLGQSRQKFMYLPEVTSDSIFAVIAEEIGFIFSSLFIFLYLFLFYRGALIAKRAPDNFGKLLAVGVVVWIAVQTILNIGGMINLIPMTGVPLPLVSYGGSAIVAALIALGILVNISKQTVNN